MLTIKEIEDSGLLIYKYIRGSHAYGLNIPTSDIDYGGIYLNTPESILGFDNDFPEEVKDERGDTAYFSLKKFMRLLLSGNPTILEALFIPERCVLLCKPEMKALIDNRDSFLSQDCFNAFLCYSVSQIKKARGLNKKCVNPITERKGVLDFCYTFKEQGSTPIKEYLKSAGIEQSRCGLTSIPNMRDMYALYYDSTGKFGYKGIVDSEEPEKSNEVRLSSIPKGEMPVTYMYFNKDAYTVHCREYREYKDWEKHRNPERYKENQEKTFDRKNVMHCVRLLHMGYEIAKTGKVNVDRTNIDREFLMGIRTGNTTYDEIITYIESAKDRLEEVIQNTVITRKHADRQLANKILTDINTEIVEKYLKKTDINTEIVEKYLKKHEENLLYNRRTI